MSTKELSSVVEVQECGWHLANFYLENGYHILSVASSARPNIWASEDGKTRNFYVRKGPTFVLGRTEDVEHVDRPERPIPA